MDIDDFKRELSNLIDRAQACELNPFEVSIALDQASEEVTENVTVSLVPQAVN